MRTKRQARCAKCNRLVSHVILRYFPVAGEQMQLAVCANCATQASSNWSRYASQPAAGVTPGEGQGE